MPQSKTSLAALIWVLSACSSHIPSPEVAPYPSLPEPAETTTNPITSTVSLWEFAPSEKSYTYQSTTSITIHEISPISARTDTVKLNTRFTINLNQLQTPTTISGHLDSVTVTRTTGPRLDLSNPTSGINFSGEITANGLILKLTTTQADCTSPLTSVLGEVRPVITSRPKTLSLTTVWTDSISALTCSGTGMPTTLRVIRSYRVLGQTTYSATQVVALERTETTNFNGSGSQEQHQVELTGVGIGTSRIYLDRITGNTVAVESTQKVDTAIRSSGRLQHFVQDITQKIQLVP